MLVELDITSLAAGGDGVGRDPGGRVVFVPRTAPGDRVRARIAEQHASFARGELVEVIVGSPDRVEPVCPHFGEGCGGCAWQHVTRPAQLAAKQAIVAGALRKLDGLAIAAIADPCPALGWRRRARFHVEGGRVGLYAYGSRRVVPVASCPQLEPELGAALRARVTAPPRDGELALVRGFRGEIAVGSVGENPAIEIEDGLWAGPWDFAQASAAGNAALIALARDALGRGPGRVLELHAGAGNFTRGFRADGWDVVPSDVVAPPRAPAGFELGAAADVLARATGRFDVIVLDPPRTGAADAIDGIVRLAPPVVVYISCDPATLARDAGRLVAGGYRAEQAWPIDVMPQTAHVEVVMKLVRE